MSGTPPLPELAGFPADNPAVVLASPLPPDVRADPLVVQRLVEGAALCQEPVAGLVAHPRPEVPSSAP